MLVVVEQLLAPESNDAVGQNDCDLAQWSNRVVRCLHVGFLLVVVSA